MKSWDGMTAMEPGVSQGLSRHETAERIADCGTARVDLSLTHNVSARFA